MGTRRRHLVHRLGRPAALPARAGREHPRTDHAGTGRAAWRPVRRRRARPGRRDDRLRPGAARRPGRDRRAQRDRPAGRRPAVRTGGAGQRPGLRGRAAAAPERRHARLAAVEPPVDAVGRRRAAHPQPRHRRGDPGGRRSRRVGLGAALVSGRLAVVPLRPQRLVEPLPLAPRLGHRGQGADRRRDRGAGLGAGQRPLRRARRRPGGRRPPPGRVRRPGRPRHRRPDDRSRPAVHGDQHGAGRAGGSVVLVAGTPTSEPGVYRVHLDGSSGPAVTVLRPPRDLGVDPGYLSVPEAISFPSAAPDGAPRTAHGLFYPPANPDREGLPGELPPLLVVIHGGPTVGRGAGAEHGRAVLDQPRVRRRRRQLRRFHRLRPRLPRAALRAVGGGRRGRLPGRRRLAGRPRPGGPRPVVHPRRLGRRLHHAGRARPRRTPCSRPAPTTSGSPT